MLNKKATTRLHKMVLTVIANINAGCLLKPKKENKLMAQCNPPVDPLLELVKSRVDCRAPNAYKQMIKS